MLLMQCCTCICIVIVFCLTFARQPWLPSTHRTACDCVMLNNSSSCATQLRISGQNTSKNIMRAITCADIGSKHFVKQPTSALSSCAVLAGAKDNMARLQVAVVAIALFGLLAVATAGANKQQHRSPSLPMAHLAGSCTSTMASHQPVYHTNFDAPMSSLQHKQWLVAP